MKKISIVLPCYNEEENIIPISDAIVEQFETNLKDYDYEIIFAENCSKDRTRDMIKIACSKNSKIKAILNAKNFGQFNSPYHAMCQATGDCSILMCSDFQDPVEMIPQFVAAWEEGNKIVCGIKATSKENGFIRMLRSVYYKMIKKMSSVEQIEHFTGFGLYDKSFVKVLSELDDPVPFLRGIVAELGYKRKDIKYEQQRRRSGKTSNNWYTLYDAAMLSVTSYTKIGLRIATIAGFILSGLSVLVAVAYTVLKLCFWDRFPAGTAPILIGVFLFGSVQLFFTGFMGEYIMTINTRLMKRPLVIEEERINFPDNTPINF